MCAWGSKQVHAAPLPSCEDEIGAHCVGEDADLSPEGIARCLKDLDVSKRSQRCDDYAKLMEGCVDDLEGVCKREHADGEGVPCLILRTSPEKLTESCRDALPSKEDEPVTLRNSLWKDGKRVITDPEEKKLLRSLSKDDQSVYKRWLARKNKRSKKNSDKSYAIRKQKKHNTTMVIVHAAAQVARTTLDGDGSKKAALKAAAKVIRKECKKATKKDHEMKFSKDDMKQMTKDAVSAAEKEIRQDALNKKKEL
jgi:hypothetical protein